MLKMGSCLSQIFLRNTKYSVLDCIQLLRNVEQTLERMIDKYNTQIDEITINIKQNITSHSKTTHSHSLQQLKKIKIIQHHKNQLHLKQNTCMQKRYQLESLNITNMQIKAIRETTNTFKQFLKQNNIEKIESLQDTMQELIQKACDIDDVLAEDTPLLISDSDIEDELLQLEMEQLPQPPTTHPTITTQTTFPIRTQTTTPTTTQITTQITTPTTTLLIN